MAEALAKQVKTKDYTAENDSNTAVILSTDKFTGIDAAWYDGSVTAPSAVFNGNDLDITIGAKTVTIQGYLQSGKVKSTVKYITVSDGAGNDVQYLLSDIVTGNAIAASSAKNGALAGSLFGDTINLAAASAPNAKKPNDGYKINAGAGDDVITGSKFNDTITGGTGSNTLQIDANVGGILTNDAVFGNDTITLTKGEKLTINFNNFKNAIGGNTQTDWAKNITAAFEKNDLKLTVYSDDGSGASRTQLGTLTIKNFKSTDTTGANGDVILTYNGSKKISLKDDWNFTSTLTSSDKSFKGTWINDNINAAAVTADKLTIAAGEGNNTIIGHSKADIVTAGKGNDVYTVSKGADKVTLGAGANTINVDTTKDFGTTEVVLTKGENLQIVVTDQAGAAFSGYVDSSLNGKDLEIKVYSASGVDASGNHNGALRGTLLVKNYAAKDTLYNLDKTLPVPMDTSSFVIYGSDYANAVYLKNSLGNAGKLFEAEANAKGAVTGTWLNDLYTASKAVDASVKLGTGNNEYAALVGTDASAITGTDTITLTKDETLTISGFETLTLNDVDVHYEKNDLVIGQKTGGTKGIKEIVIKNFKSNNAGDVLMNVNGVVYDLRDNAAVAAFGFGDTMTASMKSFTGTKNADVVDASSAATGAAIKTLDGDDIINLNTTAAFASNGANITGGAGTNTINVDTINKGFGNNIINLTKGENLVIKTTANLANAYRSVSYEKNDLVITFYKDSAKTQTSGSFTIKGFMSKDALGDAGSIVIQGADLNTEIIKDTALGGTGTVDIATNMAGVSKNTFKGTWVDDVVTGSTNADKVTMGAGNNTFIYTKGGGTDEITLTKGEKLTIHYKDTSVAKASLAVSDFTFSKDKNDLVITRGTDVIRIKNAASSMIAEELNFVTEGSDGANTAVDLTNASVLSVKQEAVVKNGKGTLSGSKLNETLKGDEWNADGTFKAASDDTIKGTAGDNNIIGGKGADKLYGGTGADTFKFAIGDGADEIYNASAADKIQFTDASVDGVSLTKVNNDLIVQAKVGSTVQSDTITLKNYFTSTDRVEEILKSDGTDLAIISEALTSMTTSGSGKINGTENDDTLDGSASDKKNTINAFGGDDTIILGDKGDTVKGTSGDKTITGGKGNDIITAGASGASGNVFNYAAGGGQDVINLTKGEKITINWSDASLHTNVISQQSPLDETDAEKNKSFDTYFEVTQKGNSVTITRKGTKDSITINNLFTSDFAQFVKLNIIDASSSSPIVHTYNPEFVNGTGSNEYKLALSVLDADKAGTLKGSGASEVFTGSNEADTITTGSGNDTINANGGDDKITIDGTGDKVVNIGLKDGNDTITFTGNALVSANNTDKTIIAFEAGTVIDSYAVSGNNLIITSYESGKKDTTTKTTTLVNYFKNSDVDATVEVFAGDITNPANKQTINLEIVKKGTTYTGTNANDTFNGTSDAEIFITKDGDDTVKTGGGADVVKVNGTGAKTVEIAAGAGDTAIELSGDVLDGTTGTNKVDIVLKGSDTTTAPVYTRDGNNLEIEYSYISGASTAKSKIIIKEYFANLDADGVILPNLSFTAKDSADADHNQLSDIRAALLSGGSLLIPVSGSAEGSSLNETFKGTSAKDTIKTGAGDDVVTAMEGDDDIYVNGTGAKTIVFRNALDGNDNIYITDKLGAGTTITLDFENSALSAGSMQLSYGKSPDGKDLIVTRKVNVLNESGSPTGEIVNRTVTLKNYFELDLTGVVISAQCTGASTIADLKAVVLAEEAAGNIAVDASKLTAANTYQGSANKDVYIASNFGDTITTGAGDDVLTLGAEKDTVTIDGEGNKTVNIAVNTGNDDIIYGGEKSVTYGGLDVKFAEASDDGLTYVKNGQNLEVTRTTTVESGDNAGEYTETTTLKNVFKADGSAVTDGITAANVKFHDGTADVTGTALSDVLTGAKALTVNAKNGKAEGSAFNDAIKGSDSADEITTGAGIDTVTAGKGDDTVTISGAGNKTINISKGDGKDVINLDSELASYTDTITLVFDKDAASAVKSVSYSADGSDLVITRTYAGEPDTKESTVVAGYFKDLSTLEAKYTNLKLQYNAGSPVDVTAYLNTNGLAVTAKADDIDGTALVETITADESKTAGVTITTGAGADVITAGKGDDTIIVNATTSGSPAEKTITIGRADGNDTIEYANIGTESTPAYGKDTVDIVFADSAKFKAGTTVYEASLDGSDLVINHTYSEDNTDPDDVIPENSAKTTLKGFFNAKSSENGLASAEIGGTSIDTTLSGFTGADEQNAVVFNGTSEDDEITGTKYADYIKAGAGEDVITTGAGDDTIIAGADAAAVTINGNEDKTFVTSREDGDAVYVIQLDSTLNEDETALKNLSGNSNTFNITTASAADTTEYKKSGNDLLITLGYNKIDDVVDPVTGEITTPGKPAAVQTVTIKDYFVSDSLSAAGKAFNTFSSGGDLSKNGFKLNGTAIDPASSGLVIDAPTREATEEDPTTYEGTSGKDFIIGTDVADVIKTGAGADVVTAGKGDDTVTFDGAGAKVLNFEREFGHDTVNFGSAGTLSLVLGREPKLSFEQTGEDGADLKITVDYEAIGSLVESKGNTILIKGGMAKIGNITYTTTGTGAVAGGALADAINTAGLSIDAQASDALVDITGTYAGIYNIAGIEEDKTAGAKITAASNKNDTYNVSSLDRAVEIVDSGSSANDVLNVTSEDARFVFDAAIGTGTASDDLYITEDVSSYASEGVKIKDQFKTGDAEKIEKININGESYDEAYFGVYKTQVASELQAKLTGNETAFEVLGTADPDEAAQAKIASLQGIYNKYTYNTANHLTDDMLSKAVSVDENTNNIVYIEGDKASTVTLSAGDDIVKVKAGAKSKVTVTSNGGSDNIDLSNTINANTITVNAENDKTVTVTGGTGVDTYTLAGVNAVTGDAPKAASIVNVTDADGEDIYTVKDAGNVLINDTADADIYNVQSSGAVTINDTDNTAAVIDTYNLAGTGTVIVNETNGADVYNITSGTVTITETAGDDTYNINSLGAKVTIADDDGTDTLAVKDSAKVNMLYNITNAGAAAAGTPLYLLSDAGLTGASFESDTAAVITSGVDLGTSDIETFKLGDKNVTSYFTAYKPQLEAEVKAFLTDTSAGRAAEAGKYTAAKLADSFTFMHAAADNTTITGYDSMTDEAKTAARAKLTALQGELKGIYGKYTLSADSYVTGAAAAEVTLGAADTNGFVFVDNTGDSEITTTAGNNLIRTAAASGKLSIVSSAKDTVDISAKAADDYELSVTANAGAEVNVAGSANADKYTVAAGAGKTVIAGGAGNDLYTIASGADVTIKDTIGANTLVVSDKASTEITAKLMLTKNGDNYDASLVIGNTKIAEAQFSHDTALASFAQTFGLKDNGGDAAKVLTASELDDSIKTAIQDADGWKVTGQADGNYASLFDGDNKAKFDAAECAIALSGTNWETIPA